MSSPSIFMSSSSYGTPGRAGSYSLPDQGIANPYRDYATGMIPKTFADVLDWSEHVATLSDDLGRGLAQLYGYFSTPLSITDNGDDIKPYDEQNISKWHLLMDQTLGYSVHEQQLGMNTGVYGNDFVTVTLMHTRTLHCPQCGWMTPVNMLREMSGTDFEFRDMKFLLRCQGDCKQRGINRKREMIVQHSYTRSAANIVVRHWPIRELDFDYLEARDKLRIYWRIPNRIRKLVLQENDVDLLHDLDWAVLESIVKNKLMEFDDRVMFHAKEPHLSGLNNRGLGLPRTLQLFRQHWLVTLLKKQCQSLAAAYVLPIQFFSLGQPQPGNMIGDSQSMMLLSQFADHMEQMTREHRRNPHKKFAVPYPVQFNVAGASANQYVPVDLIRMASGQLADSLVPQAMLRGEMTIQAAPTFIRLFESVNRAIPQLYNRFAWFFSERISELLQLEQVRVEHVPVSVADNLAIDSLLQNAAAMGKASDAAWMPRIGLNPKVERNRQLAEQRDDLEMQRAAKELQDDMGFVDQVNQASLAGSGQAQAGGDQGQGGAPAQGGAPGQGMLLPSQGFQPATTLDEMSAQAQAMASVLLGMQSYQRRLELGAARRISPEFHSLLTTAMEQQRDDARKQVIAQTLPS